MRFVKENPALAAGIGLPVLVVLFFSLATIVPGWFVDPPKYDFLFSAEFSNYSSVNNVEDEIKISVEGNKLKIMRRKKEKPDYRNETHLFLFTADNQGVREITIPAPQSVFGNDWQEVILPELQGWKLDTNTKSPDGYEFHTGRDEYYSGIWPFYGHSSGRHELSIGKNGHEVGVRTPYSEVNRYGQQTRFLGWIIAKGNP